MSKEPSGFLWRLLRTKKKRIEHLKDNKTPKLFREVGHSCWVGLLLHYLKTVNASLLGTGSYETCVLVSYTACNDRHNHQILLVI